MLQAPAFNFWIDWAAVVIGLEVVTVVLLTGLIIVIAKGVLR